MDGQDHQPGRLRARLAAVPVAPFQPWFNRWFLALSAHVGTVGQEVQQLVGSVAAEGRELDREGWERLQQLTEQLDAHLVDAMGTLRARLDAVHAAIEGEVDTVVEALLSTERQLARVEGWVRDAADLAADRVAADVADAVSDRVDTLDSLLSKRLDELSESITAIRDGAVRAWVGRPLATFDQDVADLVNWATSAHGPLQEAGLYLNGPVHVGFQAGEAFVAGVNERVVEAPFVHRALARLEPGTRVLDVGAGESTMALELANLGYLTTALEPRGYPFQHPSLTVVTRTVEDWDGPAEPFDAIVALSSVEHFGLGHYVPEGPDDLDREAMRRFATWLAPEGFLVLTVPVGAWHVDDFQRVYDRDHLLALLRGWRVVERRVYARLDRASWHEIAAACLDAAWSPPDPGVALIVCTPEG